VPAPNNHLFKGKIGRTVGESSADWPPLARASGGSRRTCLHVLDDVGYRPRVVRFAIIKTPHLDKLAKAACVTTTQHHPLARRAVPRFLTAATTIPMPWPASRKAPPFSGSYGRVPLANGLCRNVTPSAGGVRHRQWHFDALGKT